MGPTASKVQHDFDVISQLEQPPWQVNEHYRPLLLQTLPHQIGSALEVGCGTGGLLEALAPRCQSLVGIDFSPLMAEKAKQRVAAFPQTQVWQGDFNEYRPDAGFDLIVSVATLHHLDVKQFIEKSRGLLKPGGILLIQDLLASRTLWDKALDVAALGASAYHRLRTGPPYRQSAQARRAWDEHFKSDEYMTFPQARTVFDQHLPGNQLTRHLLWRYTMVWRSPVG